MTDWEAQVDEYMNLAYSITNSSLIRKYRSNLLDQCLRCASDIISCENTNINNNTQSMLQWCLRWTENAVVTYETAKQLLTVVRNGKPPTHRQICDARGENGKRFWTVEHEHPLLIPKTGLMDEQWTLKQLRTWMYDYGYATIVTQEENKRLLKTTSSMEVAIQRYTNADMKVVYHYHHRPYN